MDVQSRPLHNLPDSACDWSETHGKLNTPSLQVTPFCSCCCGTSSVSLDGSLLWLLNYVGAHAWSVLIINELYSSFCACSSYNLTQVDYPPAIFLVGHRNEKLSSHSQSVHIGKYGNFLRQSWCLGGLGAVIMEIETETLNSHWAANIVH